jgi:hypothetical protein
LTAAAITECPCLLTISPLFAPTRRVRAAVEFRFNDPENLS